MTDQFKMVPIFKTNDQGLLMILQSVLNGAEIPFFVRGEEAASLMPLKATIVVPEPHVEAAKGLLEGIQQAHVEADPETE